jgi:hypothetical protein
VVWVGDQNTYSKPHTVKETYPQIAGTGKELSVLMEGNGHNTVSGIERFFNAVTMVYIDINVEHSAVVTATEINSWPCYRVVKRKGFTGEAPRYPRRYLNESEMLTWIIILEFRTVLTIDVAEATGFALFGMVETTCPIHRDIAFVATESSRSLYVEKASSNLIKLNCRRASLPIEPPADIEQ